MTEKTLVRLVELLSSRLYKKLRVDDVSENDLLVFRAALKDCEQKADLLSDPLPVLKRIERLSNQILRVQQNGGCRGRKTCNETD